MAVTRQGIAPRTARSRLCEPGGGGAGQAGGAAGGPGGGGRGGFGGGPQIASGTYRVVLKVDGKEYIQLLQATVESNAGAAPFFGEEDEDEDPDKDDGDGSL